MKIKETVERECCQFLDLHKYSGEILEVENKEIRKYLYFCRHCGQIWRKTRQGDAAGGTETVYERMLCL